jgi:hypothetical protein
LREAWSTNARQWPQSQCLSEQQYDPLADAAIELVQRRMAGQGEVKQVKSLTHLATELLSEQHLEL